MRIPESSLFCFLESASFAPLGFLGQVYHKGLFWRNFHFLYPAIFQEKMGKDFIVLPKSQTYINLWVLFEIPGFLVCHSGLPGISCIQVQIVKNTGSIPKNDYRKQKHARQ
jgi:hypothetical protein